MGSYRLGVLAGDGIGPEIVTASVAVVDAAIARAGVDAIEWHELPFGAAALEEFGVHTPEVTLTTLEGLDGWLLGPHDSVSYPEPHRSLLNPSGTVRKHFGLYANIRPAKAFEGGKAIVPGTDLVIARENTAGFYADRNTFGDILSDLAGEIAGSLGIAPSLNSSDTHAMAQAAHGSAPDIAGRDLANPIAMQLSSAMLLDWLAARHDDSRLAAAARRIDDR